MYVKHCYILVLVERNNIHRHAIQSKLAMHKSMPRLLDVPKKAKADFHAIHMSCYSIPKYVNKHV